MLGVWMCHLRNGWNLVSLCSVTRMYAFLQPALHAWQNIPINTTVSSSYSSSTTINSCSAAARWEFPDLLWRETLVRIFFLVHASAAFFLTASSSQGSHLINPGIQTWKSTKERLYDHLKINKAKVEGGACTARFSVGSAHLHSLNSLKWVKRYTENKYKSRSPDVLFSKKETRPCCLKFPHFNI